MDTCGIGAPLPLDGPGGSTAPHCPPLKRRQGARAGAALLALVALAAPVGALAYMGDPATGAPATAPIGRCAVTATSEHSPTHLRVGETVGVTVSLSSECGYTPVNMVLVLDASGSGQMTENVLVWAEDMVDFALSVMPLTRVGIVTYNDRATAQCEITADGDVLRACIASIVTGGGRRLDLGLLEAAAMFARSEPADPELALVTANIAIVLLAGLPDPDCTAAIEAGRELQGVAWPWSIYPCDDCATPDARAVLTCARRVAGSPRYFFSTWDGFLGLFEEQTRPLHPAEVVVSTTLPVSISRAMLYEPFPDEFGRTMTWSFAAPIPNPLTFQYRVYANRVGSYAIGDTSAEVDFDGLGYRRDINLKLAPQVIHVSGSIWLPMLAQGR